jgi:glycerol-3-phosphate acyltransferase PlsY
MFDGVGSVFLVACFSYGLGSIPFGLILTKMAGADDIRRVGSGNIGATNVLRTGNKKLAIATLICDASKGVGVVWLVAQTTTPALTALASILVVAGHCFPIWLKFTGGKGVATSLAVMATLDLRLGAVFVFVWLVTAFLSRYSSLSALLAMMACVVTGFMLLDSNMTKIVILVLGSIVWTRHHTNIGRLLSGTETKIGVKKS